MSKALHFALLFLITVSAGFAQSVIRGPYLQSPTSSSIIVRWRTDSLMDSRVYYGTNISSLTAYVDSSNLTTEHRIKISGLAPFTKYYYTIGSSTNIMDGPDAMQHFVTSPVPGTDQPVRVWAIGDFGKATPEQGAVRDAYTTYTDSVHTDVWIWLGDNTYQNGTDEEYQTKVFDSLTGYYRLFKYIPFMPCPGNHDYNSINPVPGTIDPNLHTGPYYDMIDVPTEGEAGGVASHKELFYSFDYGDVHFISLNSELGSTTVAYDWTGAYTNNFTGSPLTQWLEADLAANTRKWTIAYWHQLPYSAGDVFSDDWWQFYMAAMRKHINPILESHGVDMVVCGHDHNYQRTYLINGHYGVSGDFTPFNMIDGSSGKDHEGHAYVKTTTGPNAGKGTVYVCEGNSGAGNPTGPVVHPAIYFGDNCDTCTGSFVFDINGDRLDGRYLRSTGVIGDEFTIIKDNGTGIDNLLALNNLKISPNPFSTYTNIEYTLNERTDFTIDLFDLSGRKLMGIYKGTQDAGTYTHTLDLTNAGFAKSTYIVRLTAGVKSVSEKLMSVR